MRRDSGLSEMPYLSVSNQTRMPSSQLVDPLCQLGLLRAFLAWTIQATFEGCIAVRPRFEKEYGWEQIEFSQNLDHLSKRREASGAGEDRRVWAPQIGIDFLVHPPMTQ
jgi:hypothetical protein